MSSLEHALRKEEITQALNHAEAFEGDLRRFGQELDGIRLQNEASSTLIQTTLSGVIEEQVTVRERLDALPQIGTSLADIAAYIHAAELRHGSPSSPASDRTLERLRSTALQLHKQSHGESS